MEYKCRVIANQRLRLGRSPREKSLLVTRAKKNVNTIELIVWVVGNFVGIFNQKFVIIQ